MPRVASFFAYRRPPVRGAAVVPALFATLVATAPALVRAEDGADGSALRLSGFGTIGASWGDDGDWGFKREVTQRAHRDDGVRADVDTRLGLQAAWSPSPQWEATGQLLLKPRSRGASLHDNLSQAFVAWHPSADWSLRAGRTSPDLFLLADSRHVGFSYPWMRPSVEFYGWAPLMPVDGVDAARQWSAGDAQITAKVSAGRASLIVPAAGSGSDTHAHAAPIYSATLRADAGALSLKGSFAHAVASGIDGSVHQVAELLDTLQTLPVPVVAAQARQLRAALPAGSRYLSRYSALGVIWDAQPWQLQAEFARIGGNSNPTKATYGYASATWRQGEVSLFTMAGLARSTWAPLPEVDWLAALTPVLGASGAAAAQQAALGMARNYNHLRVQQRSLTAGLRWDFMPQADFKVQLDLVHTAADGGGLWTYGTASPHHAAVLSTGADFVF